MSNEDKLNSDIEVIEKFGKLFEVGKVEIFRGFRLSDSREIEIEVTDFGQKAGNLRYHVVSRLVDTPEKIATGNGGSTLEHALGILHWSDLE